MSLRCSEACIEPSVGSKGIAEINASPVVFRWNKFDLGLA